MTHLHIVTPCTRPQNISWIEWSLNIPDTQYTWWIVCDAPKLPQMDWPLRSQPRFIRDKNSRWGNAQRNLALDQIADGWVYFLDDDTFLHPNLWPLIQNSEADFIHFRQEHAGGKLRLKAQEVSSGKIDSGCFVAKRSVIGDIRWELGAYDADGKFAQEVYARAQSREYHPVVASVYNAIDK